MFYFNERRNSTRRQGLDINSVMKSICVFGVFVADLCFIGDLIPSKGQTILGNNHIIGPGGKGSNQAIACARLGGNVNFITKVGKDLNADMALTLYKEVFGKDFPETISNSWGFPPIGEIRNAIISKKPIKVRKKDLLRKGIIL